MATFTVTGLLAETYLNAEDAEKIAEVHRAQ